MGARGAIWAQIQIAECSLSALTGVVRLPTRGRRPHRRRHCVENDVIVAVVATVVATFSLGM